LRIRKRTWIYIAIHAALLIGACLFPLYRAIAAMIPRALTRCVLHDRLFLYCPLCGGTRAIGALLSLDLAAAFRYNAFVTLLVLAAICLDLVVLVRLLFKKQVLLRIPAWVWVALAVLMLLYAVLRNWLMISFGFDPAGDLGVLWNLRYER
jgi:hypothetical protein